MSDHIAKVNAFLDAYWHDDAGAVERLIHSDFRWDNVPFHTFALENGDITVGRPRVRQGQEGLGSLKAMQFRDAATGEMVSQDEGVGGHEVIFEAETPDGTVLQERIDLTGLRGAVVKMRCAGVFEFRDDRIVVWRDIFDVSHWSTQLKVLGLEYAGYATDAAA